MTPLRILGTPDPCFAALDPQGLHVHSLAFPVLFSLRKGLKEGPCEGDLRGDLGAT